MCRQGRLRGNGKSATRSAAPEMEISEAALNSETIWMRSVGFQHPLHKMGKFVPMIDWQVFQIRAVLGEECWLAVMRQSGLSP